MIINLIRGGVKVAKCKSCGNTTNFNVWCQIKKILEVEIDKNNQLVGVVGEPEDEALREEEITIADGDLQFAMVNCAWCGSEDIEFEEGEKQLYVREQ